MKTISKLVLLIFVCLPMPARSQGHLPTSSHEVDTSEFYHLTQKWMVLYNGPDAKMLAPLYAEDAEYISSHVPGLVAHGRDRLIANFQKGMNQGGHIDAVQILSINISCEMATLVCRYDANNSGQKVSGRNVLILKKVNSKWLIITHVTVV